MWNSSFCFAEQKVMLFVLLLLYRWRACSFHRCANCMRCVLKVHVMLLGFSCRDEPHVDPERYFLNLYFIFTLRSLLVLANIFARTKRKSSRCSLNFTAEFPRLILVVDFLLFFHRTFFAEVCLIAAFVQCSGSWCAHF